MRLSRKYVTALPVHLSDNCSLSNCLCKSSLYIQVCTARRGSPTLQVCQVQIIVVNWVFTHPHIVQFRCLHGNCPKLGCATHKHNVQSLSFTKIHTFFIESNQVSVFSSHSRNDCNCGYIWFAWRDRLHMYVATWSHFPCMETKTKANNIFGNKFKSYNLSCSFFMYICSNIAFLLLAGRKVPRKPKRTWVSSLCPRPIPSYGKQDWR